MIPEDDRIFAMVIAALVLVIALFCFMAHISAKRVDAARTHCIDAGMQWVEGSCVK